VKWHDRRNDQQQESAHGSRGYVFFATTVGEVLLTIFALRSQRWD
jgi:hypothetical protein